MAAAVADVIQHFITAMDSLKLSMTAVDQVGGGGRAGLLWRCAAIGCCATMVLCCAAMVLCCATMVLCCAAMVLCCATMVL